MERRRRRASGRWAWLLAVVTVVAVGGGAAVAARPTLATREPDINEARRRGDGELETFYRALDKDADGDVDAEELKGMLREVGSSTQAFDEEEELEQGVKGTMERVDKDHDAQVLPNELAAQWLRFAALMTPNRTGEWLEHAVGLPNSVASAFVRVGVTGMDLPRTLNPAKLARMLREVGVEDQLSRADRAKLIGAVKLRLMGVGEAPHAPALRAVPSATRCGTVLITWSATASGVSSKVHPEIHNYRLLRREARDNPVQEDEWRLVYSGMSGAFTDRGLARAPAAYDYRVEAWNLVGHGAAELHDVSAPSEACGEDKRESGSGLWAWLFGSVSSKPTGSLLEAAQLALLGFLGLVASRTWARPAPPPPPQPAVAPPPPVVVVTGRSTSGGLVQVTGPTMSSSSSSSTTRGARHAFGAPTTGAAVVAAAMGGGPPPPLTTSSSFLVPSTASTVASTAMATAPHPAAAGPSKTDKLAAAGDGSSSALSVHTNATTESDVSAGLASSSSVAPAPATSSSSGGEAVVVRPLLHASESSADNTNNATNKNRRDSADELDLQALAEVGVEPAPLYVGANTCHDCGKRVSKMSRHVCGRCERVFCNNCTVHKPHATVRTPFGTLVPSSCGIESRCRCGPCRDRDLALALGVPVSGGVEVASATSGASLSLSRKASAADAPTSTSTSTSTPPNVSATGDAPATVAAAAADSIRSSGSAARSPSPPRSWGGLASSFAPKRKPSSGASASSFKASS